MGYYSKALLYIEGGKAEVSDLVEYIHSKRSARLRVIGLDHKLKPSPKPPEYNSYDFLSDYMQHDDWVLEPKSSIIFTVGWFKAYGEWESLVSDIKDKCGNLDLQFHYGRIGENIDDIVLDNPEDGPEIGVERRFVIPCELGDVFDEVEVL